VFKTRLTSPGVPEVGIFWFIQEPGKSPTLLADGTPLEDGEVYREYINYPGDHSKYWPEIKWRLTPFFHHHGPKDWPRGRVFYNTKTQRFDVYLNDQLRTPGFEGEILAYFNLSKAQTSFASDPHYADADFTIGPEGPKKGDP